MKGEVVFYDWLNEITDETLDKDDSLCISPWAVAGLKNGAPEDVKIAFEEFVKEEEHWCHNRTTGRPL